MRNSVLSYLEETCKKYPDKVAIVDKNGSLSFGELRERALVISQSLYRLTAKIKVPVFVYLPKSADAITAMMAVLYCNSFYTPTDVKFPIEKVRRIVEELGPEAVITNSEFKENIKACGISEDIIIDIDELDFNLSEENESNVTLDLYEKTIDTDLAYILFTSGSTGVPKGVCITHRSIIDYIDWAKECFDIASDCTIGSQAPFYFDNSTLDLYLMLSCGATLNIIPEQLFAFPARLMDYVKDNQINTIFWVPSVFVNVVNAGVLDENSNYPLKKILFAGEIMPNKYLNCWRKAIPTALYANLYGPTEITVDCTCYVVDREFRDDEPLPIGRPCRNSHVLLLDKEKRLVTKPNEIGELCVRGTSLAVGYWRNPEKTAEVFIQNPFNQNYEEKIYCTGDLAHYNEFGEIMYDGRKDSQVKHMGYRIELGEIETAVLGIKEIDTACVIYDQDNKNIVLFYIGDIDKNMIRKQLFSILPKYMIPTVYLQMEIFPYNDNGKIDRKALKDIMKEVTI